MKHFAALTAATLFALPVLADEPIGEGAYDLPIFDAHIHYKEPAWEPFPVETVIELMDQSGVAMGLVSSSPDEGTIMLHDYAPNRVVPELRPYHRGVTSSNWTSDPDMATYLAGRLHDHPHEGIGEFHIRNNGMRNEPLFREIIAMAKEGDLYLHVHAGADQIRWLYSLDPDVKIIWAHAGLGAAPQVTYDTMKEFPELLADTSLKEFSILRGGETIEPIWMDILTEFQDRLMVGSDTWVNGQWQSYGVIIDTNRKWLSMLPREVAEKIAYKNAERVFGRTISMDQIGTR